MTITFILSSIILFKCDCDTHLAHLFISMNFYNLYSVFLLSFNAETDRTSYEIHAIYFYSIYFLIKLTHFLCKCGIDFFSSSTEQRKTYEKPTHIAQTEEPWSRLHDAATMASSRRSVMHSEHQVSSSHTTFNCLCVTSGSRATFQGKCTFSTLNTLF